MFTGRRRSSVKKGARLLYAQELLYGLTLSRAESYIGSQPTELAKMALPRFSVAIRRRRSKMSRLAAVGGSVYRLPDVSDLFFQSSCYFFVAGVGVYPQFFPSIRSFLVICRMI